MLKDQEGFFSDSHSHSQNSHKRLASDKRRNSSNIFAKEIIKQIEERE